MRHFQLRSWRILLPLLLLLVGIFSLQIFWADRTTTSINETSSRGSHGLLRVGSPDLERQASAHSPYGPGFEIELVSSFCSGVATTPQWVVVADKATGLAMLEHGEIDLLVGFWDNENTENKPDSTKNESPIAKGKAYAHFTPMRISSTAGASVDDGKAKGEDTPEAQRDSSTRTLSEQVFSGLLGNFGDAPDSTGTEWPFPVFSLVENGLDIARNAVLLDPASYALWLPFMGEVTSKKIGRQTPFRWFWRNDASPLATQLGVFWEDPARTVEIAELTERYFGFLPKKPRAVEILELADVLAAQLHKYESFILKAAKETGVPPLLLVAIIYQESRFDPDAVSQTRVRGIMQLTTATADMLGVDRKDPEQCIMGGARYMRDLWNQVGDKANNDWDRWFMALAAYNQGMSNLNRTIRLAQNMGKKGDSWADLKHVFPLSTTCRGIEAKSFVERVRYYNFILHGLVAIAPAETQDFAPLLGLAVADAEI